MAKDSTLIGTGTGLSVRTGAWTVKVTVMAPITKTAAVQVRVMVRVGVDVRSGEGYGKSWGGCSFR